MQFNSKRFRALFGKLKEDYHFWDVIKNGSLVFSFKVLGALLGFAFSILLARFYGIEGTSIYFLALTFNTIGAILGRIGMDNTIVRVVAPNVINKNWGRVKGVEKTSRVIIIVAGLIISLALLLLAKCISINLFDDPSLTTPIRLMSVGIIPMSFTFLYTELLKSARLVKFSVFLQGFGPNFISIIFLVVLFYFSHIHFQYIYAYLFSITITALLGHVFWKAKISNKPEISITYPVKELISRSIPLMFIMLLTMTNNIVPTIALGALSPKETVGVFGVSLKIIMLISFVIISVNSIAAPKYAHLLESGKTDEALALAKKLTRFLILLSFPPILIMIIFPQFVLSIFGKDFVDGSLTLQIMLIAQMVNIGAGPVGYLLMMAGKERKMVKAIIFTSSINFVLSPLLIYKFSLLGAAIGYISVLSLQNILLKFFVRKYITLPK